MIPLLLSLQFLAASAETVIVYEGVPVQVVRVQLFEWPAARLVARATGEGSPGRVALRGTPARLYVAIFARQDGAYLLDGPFAWPREDAERAIPVRWYRTLRGDVPDAAGVEPSVEWIRADTLSGPMPLCVRDDVRSWSCWGVLPENRGVLVLGIGGSIFWAVTGSGSVPPLRRAQWGRLLMVTDDRASGATVRVTFGHPVSPPAVRLGGIRLDSASVAGTHAVAIAPSIVWIAGNDVPAKAWAEVRTDAAGPVYLVLPEVSEGPASVPLHVALRDRRAIEGRVFASNGAAASGTLLTAFRLIEPPPPDGRRVQPRRVFAAETIADANGMFTIDALGDAEYELMAWHSQFGRASQMLPADDSSVTVHLRAAGVARGRVLVGGRPADRVGVVSVPDPAAFSVAEDITDVKGGDGRTGPDGRFVVSLASSGAGELRIGGGGLGVKRIPLPRPPVAVLDLGDIEIGPALEVTIVLDRDPGCDLRAAGPVGRTGLQIVPGTRATDVAYRFALPESGLWEFTLVCVGTKRSVAPGVVQIDAAQSGKEVRLTVR